MWQKIKDWFHNSLTIALARAKVALGIALALLVDVMQDQTVRDAVTAALQPKYVPFWLILIGVLVEGARRRTLR